MNFRSFPRLFWIAALFTTIAIGLRITANTITPPSPYWEEVALGYDAWSILQTGKDHHGNSWPIVAFESFGDYKPSLYFYSVVPSVAAFGLNIFAVRFPAVIASSLTVGLATILAFQLCRSSRVAGWTGFLLALQPWSWWIGRIGFEVNLATMLMVLGIVTLIHHLKKPSRHWSWLIFATIAFSMSMYAYHGARLLAPVLAAWTWISYLPWSTWKTSWKSWILQYGAAALLALALISPILLALQSPVVQQRVAETSIFSDVTPVLQANQAREAAGNTLVSRVLYHRYWFRSEDILTRWASHLSPDFLFIAGDQNPRHSAQYFGMLYPWEFFTILIGLAWSTSLVRRRLLGFTLIAPVAAALTTGTPHALRALILSVFLALWSASGAWIASKWFTQKIRSLFSHKLAFWGTPAMWGSITLLVLASTSVAWLYWLEIYPNRYSQEWQYGYQEVVHFLNENTEKETPIYFSRAYGRPAMYVWFFSQTPPESVQAFRSQTELDQGEFLRYENWHFVTSWPDTESAGWYVGPANSLPSAAVLQHEVTDPNQTPQWHIGVIQ